MQYLTAVAMLMVLATSASAQATTAVEVAAFPASVTNPLTGVPLAVPVIYPIASVLCNQTKAGEVLPIINPGEYRIDDPLNLATRDCLIDIASQFDALPLGNGYHAAWRNRTATGPLGWSPLGTAFAIEAPQTHPCDGTPPITGTVLAGTRTLSWCWNGLDTNGVATTVTTWTATVDGVRVVLSGVTAGATVNAQGKRLYSAFLPVTAGTRVIRVAGTNAVGEAAFSQTFTVTVTLPPSVPSASEIRGIS